MAVELPDARELPDVVLECLRLRGLHACEQGYSEVEVGDILGVSRETVSRWWSAYCRGGVEAVPGERTGRPVGSGRLLSEEQAAHVQHLIDDHCPHDWGIASPLWTRRAVRDLIGKEYGIVLPLRTVGAYLRRWGYSPKKPRLKARHQDPEEVREWLENIYPAIVEAAEREGGEIQWCDEKGVGANDYPGRGYARVGQTPELTVASKPCHMNQIATISNEGKVRFMTYKATMTATVFVEFLRRLIQGASRKIFLIVDHLRVHESAEVDNWVEAHKERIELFYLPHYAGELNPDEYLNNDLKGNVHEEGLPGSEDEVRSGIQRFMRMLLHWSARVASYFEHPDVQYAGP